MVRKGSRLVFMLRRAQSCRFHDRHLVRHRPLAAVHRGAVAVAMAMAAAVTASADLLLLLLLL